MSYVSSLTQCLILQWYYYFGNGNKDLHHFQSAGVNTILFDLVWNIYVVWHRWGQIDGIDRNDCTLTETHIGPVVNYGSFGKISFHIGISVWCTRTSLDKQNTRKRGKQKYWRQAIHKNRKSVPMHGKWEEGRNLLPETADPAGPKTMNRALKWEITMQAHVQSAWTIENTTWNPTIFHGQMKAAILYTVTFWTPASARSARHSRFSYLLCRCFTTLYLPPPGVEGNVDSVLCPRSVGSKARYTKYSKQNTNILFHCFERCKSDVCQKDRNVLW